MKHRSDKISQPWVTKSLIRACRKKSRLHKIYKKFPNDINKIKYRNYKRLLKACISNAEKDYHHEQFQLMANDMRKTWKTINSIMNKDNSHQSSINLMIDNEIVNELSIIVEKFDTLFVNIGPKLAPDIPVSNKSFTEFLPPRTLNSLGLFPTDRYEIEQVIKV